MPPAARASRDRNAAGRAENQRPRDRTGRPLPYDTTHRPLAETFTYATVDEALAGGVWLWNRQRYFESHEALEIVWRAADDADRDFWQGVVQVAVGCVHHQRGNVTGSARLLTRAADHLARYPDVHHGVDVEQLVAFCRAAATAMREAGTCVQIGYPAFPAMDGGPWLDDDATVTTAS